MSADITWGENKGKRKRWKMLNKNEEEKKEERVKKKRKCENAK
jgi:hypothetical protein